MEIEIVNGDERQAAAESFRDTTETRLAALEGKPGHGPQDETTADGDNIAGILRTFEARILQMETLVAENTSANLRLADALKALQDQVKAQQPPGQ